jgi:hypothetical protein
MAQQTINAGSPPIVWSTVEDAFTKINANFDELYGSIGGPGGILDFNSLSTDIIPSASEVYDLGSPTLRWRDLYLAGSSLYLGTAQITANLAGIVNLPAGTTVNGELIRNPAETNFKTIAVSGQSSIVADSFEDTLTVAAGNAGITLTTNAGTDTLTITNSGVLSISGTADQIGAATVSGVTTLTNLGVLSLVGEAQGIGISGTGRGDVTITNLGVKRVLGTIGEIGVTDSGGGNYTLRNLAPASPTFRYIVVDGATLQPVAADNLSDTLNLISGAGITIAKDITTDTLTFSVNSSLDIKGSVFGDNSSIIVDGTENKVYADFFGNLTGNADTATNAVTANKATTVTLVATNTTAATHYITFVDTATGDENVRTDTDLTYNPNTNTLTAGTFSGNVTGTVTGNIFTSLIDSLDSSAITVTPSTIFSSDVTVENELIVSNGITFSDGSVLRSYRPVTVVAATTTAQTINDGASASYIQFVETVDTAGAYSPGVFTAPYTGYYQVNLSLYFSTTVTLTSGSFFLIDSNPDVVIFSGDWTGSYLHYSTVIPATAGATIGFVFRQVSGAAIDISSGSRLTIHRVSIGA